MTVYVVREGEEYDGEQIVGVYSTLDRARAIATALIEAAANEGKQFLPVDHKAGPHGDWVAWRFQREFIVIEPFELDAILGTHGPK